MSISFHKRKQNLPLNIAVVCHLVYNMQKCSLKSGKGTVRFVGVKKPAQNVSLARVLSDSEERVEHGHRQRLEETEMPPPPPCVSMSLAVQDTQRASSPVSQTGQDVCISVPSSFILYCNIKFESKLACFRKCVIDKTSTVD